MDPNIQLHVSLAGGRKSMGFFAANALSVWGRDIDRFTDVLVSEPYESKAMPPAQQSGPDRPDPPAADGE